MKRLKKIDIDQIPLKVLLLNLYLTQLITLFLALSIFFIFHQQTPIEILLLIIPKNVIKALILGVTFAIIVIFINLILTKVLPKDLLDDGGINEKLFKNTSIWHIAIIAIIVGFFEEVLFRGAIQPFFGVFGTSLIFSAIHFRYLDKYILLIVTFIISIGLGYLAEYFGLLSSIIAHVLIDFVLGVLIKKGWLI